MVKFEKPFFRNEFFFFLLPLFFILHRYIEHLEAIPVRDAVLLFLEYVLWMLGFFVLFLFIYKKPRKAFLFIFFLFFFNFYFGSIHDWFKLNLGKNFFSQYSFILPLGLLVLGFIFLFIWKSNSRFNRMTRYLNVLLIVLIAIDMVQFVIKKNQIEKSKTTITKCNNCKTPDIYLILTDGYAGSRQLRHDFNYDNSDFENYLRSKGFYLIDSSLSNYPSTVLSLSSMFNMEYLKTIKGTESHEVINQTKLYLFLKSLGYRIKNYSIFKVDGQPPYVTNLHFPTGTGLITSNTFIPRIEKDLRHNLAKQFKIRPEIERINRLVEANKRKTILKDSLVLDGLLREISNQSDQPRFIYSHFNVPHNPYFFDKDGKEIPGFSSKQEHYIGYLEYGNAMFKKLIDHIFSSYKEPPVIIFMSDHGLRNGNGNKLNPHWYYTINAVYYPGGNYSGLYKGMSNVNQFRVLLNKHFDQKMPLLKDSVVHVDEKLLGPLQ